MSGLSAGKASAVLILVISISLFQATVFLIQPKNSSLISIYGASPRESVSTGPPVGSTQISAASIETITVATTVPTTVPTIVPTTILVTSSTTVMSQPSQDYTPFAIVIIVALAMIALVVMFMRRQRQR